MSKRLALGRTVKLGSLKLSILSGGVAADDLSVADDAAHRSRDAGAPFLQAKSVKIGVELLPLIFSHRLNVTAISIEEPQVVLIRDSISRAGNVRRPGLPPRREGGRLG